MRMRRLAKAPFPTWRDGRKAETHRGGLLKEKAVSVAPHTGTRMQCPSDRRTGAQALYARVPLVSVPYEMASFMVPY